MGPQCEWDCESPVSDVLDLLNMCSVTLLSIRSTAEEVDFYACVQTHYIACVPFQASISIHICILPACGSLKIALLMKMPVLTPG